MGGLASPAVLGLMAGGTVTQAVGQARAGKAAERAGQFNARLERAETAARVEQMVGQARRSRSDNITRIAKSGVRLSGSPLAVLEENEYQEQRQRDFVSQAGSLAAELQTIRGRNARDASRMGIASTVIGGAGNLGAFALRHA